MLAASIVIRSESCAPKNFFASTRLEVMRDLHDLGGEELRVPVHEVALVGVLQHLGLLHGEGALFSPWVLPALPHHAGTDNRKNKKMIFFLI